MGESAAGLSDAAVEQLRDQLYGIAQAAISIASGGGGFVTVIPDEESDDFQERAAIREHDGGLPRAKAELAAVIDIVTGRPLHG